MAKLYIADLHFNSKGIIRFDDRPYDSVLDMNEDLINRWNDKVNKSDDVYILGDVFLGGSKDEQEAILQRLKGNKHLIVGNHDKSLVNGRLKHYFSSINELKTVQDSVWGKAYKVVLCHYPIPVYNGHFREDRVHLYGHVHKTFEEDATLLHLVINNHLAGGRNIQNMLNVGCMMSWMGYEPKTLAELLPIIEEQKAYLSKVSDSNSKLIEELVQLIK